MNLEQKILDKINEYNHYNVIIDKETNLTSTVGLDSLSFIGFMDELEIMLDIEFDIREIAKCTNVGNLIRLTEEKLNQKLK